MEEKWLKNITWFVAGVLLIALIVGSMYVLIGKNIPGTPSAKMVDPENRCPDMDGSSERGKC